LIEVEVQSLLETAQARATAQGTLDRSMRGLQASQVGALGELVGVRFLKQRGVGFTEVYSTKYDVHFVSNDGVKTMEFKTKERTVAPRPDYDCTVPLYNHEHQRPDYYFFISLLSSGKSDDIRRFTKAYILGVISLEQLEAVGKRWTPQQVDETNNWRPTIDCINVKVSDLTSLG
jgi:hypothetical protein